MAEERSSSLTSGSDGGSRVSAEEVASAADDLLASLDLLVRCSLSTEGLTSVEEAQDRLYHHLQGRARGSEPQRSPSKVMGAIQDEVKRDSHIRVQLLKVLSQAEEYLHGLDQPQRDQLDAAPGVQGWEDKLTWYQDRLTRNDCPILVAGETSAGKSSILNMLLGEEILPYSLLSTTSVICELKYGAKRCAVAHLTEPDPTTGGDTVDIAFQDTVPVMQQLAPYVQQRGDRSAPSPYKKVEIFWPLAYLKGGIVIVDSPGIGESDDMTKHVISYLPQAFAFIYVINSGTAGGVQEDRLQNLLKMISEKKDGDWLHHFNPEAAIFVCNKWDQVPGKEADEVNHDTWKKLKRCWPGIKEHQLYYLSAKTAFSQFRAAGILTKDFEELTHGIEELLPASLHNRLESTYKWLSNLLKRSAFCQRVQICSALMSADQRQREYLDIMDRIDKLESRAEAVMKGLEKELNTSVRQAIESLETYLINEKQTITRWTEQEAPTAKDFSVINEETANLIRQRLQTVVNCWKDSTRPFQKIQDDLMRRFQEEFRPVEDQVAAIRVAMEHGGGAAEELTVSADSGQQSLDLINTQWTPGQKVAIALTSPIWLPFAIVAGVIYLPVAGIKTLYNKIVTEQKMKTYHTDKARFMRERAEETLESFCEGSNLRKVMDSHMAAVWQWFGALRESIPALLRAEKRLLQSVQQEKTQNRKAVGYYKTFYQQCLQLQGKLDKLYMRDIRKYEIDYGSIICDRTTDFISEGSFGAVYRASLKKADGSSQPVALKILKDDILDTVSEFLVEEDNLKRMQHPNVVRFLGSSCRKTKSGRLELFMVLELCDTTLKRVIFHGQQNIPAKHKVDSPAFIKAREFLRTNALQIASGLAYIHGNGLVHRDLKLDNILMKKGTVKIADLGLAKPMEIIAGTSHAGALLYAAPEKLRGEVYNFKADVYSFGLLLWEMWYGIHVFKNLESASDLAFVEKIKEGARPDLVGKTAPSGEWAAMMEECWDGDANRRPAARTISERLQELKQAEM
ncbi:uncharacterized protein [Branchiostoma lanceolatum]|uniref:uncharacterized protein n=1 Tax=Branchiostoma lanceolatum TaxID=7740 RepID=UPI0034531BBA